MTSIAATPASTIAAGTTWNSDAAHSVAEPAVQDGIKELIALGFHKPGDVEDRLGYYLGTLER